MSSEELDRRSAAVLVCSVSFALTQALVLTFLGAELTDILAAIVSLVALALFLQMWKPREIYRTNIVFE